MEERWNFNNRERIIIIRVRAAVKVKLRNHKVIQTSTLLLVHSILFLGSLRLLFYSFSYHSLTTSRELECEAIETSVNLSTTTTSEEACKRWASMLQIYHRQQWGLLGIALCLFLHKGKHNNSEKCEMSSHEKGDRLSGLLLFLLSSIHPLNCGTCGGRGPSTIVSHLLLSREGGNRQ